MSKVGLVDAHAYSLINVYEEQDDAGNKVRLVKIRNPWGQKEWQGDWSDKSEKWLKAKGMKERVGLEDKDDGIFFISLSDYKEFFYITTICKYINGNDYSLIADFHAFNDYCVVEFNLERDYPEDIVFTLN
mmetsp:Transcript_19879/g.18894  ORF Transcript_19879/g.18894 Transcript_19879/m.18894 type:complete len:131 (-) Transcript_19879:12-404(-)